VVAEFSYPFEDRPKGDVAATARQHTQPLVPLQSRHSRRGIQLQVPSFVRGETALATLQAPEQRIGTKRDCSLGLH
jgi:hypothetical protein